ncbi:MAG: flippase-like domain-containing protein [Thermomicrobiales bacterium]|nr:flippase-like domain-containing protein [Thermomicrobiales bacterium]
MNRRRIILGFAVSAFFLFFALRGQDYGAIREAFSQVTYWYLIPALGLYIIGLLVRAYRWSVLLRPVEKVSPRTLVGINAVGLMANNVLPLRTGEFVRAYALSQRTNIKKSTGLATIAVERIFDGMALLTFIAGSMLFVDMTSQLNRVAELALAVFALALVALVLLARGGRVRDRMLQLALGPLPENLATRVNRMAESFISGLGIFHNWRQLTLVSVSSLIAWGFEASMYWMVARAFGGSISAVMGVPESLLTTGIANLATLVPSSPGYVGPYEAAVILVLSGALGLTRELALSYGVLVHVLLWLPVTIWGVIEWSRLHLSLRQVEDAEYASDPDAVTESSDVFPASPRPPAGVSLDS